MPRERSKNNQENEKLMFKKLTDAINCLAQEICVLHNSLGSITRQDLKESEDRIIKEIQFKRNAEITSDIKVLKTSADSLNKAVVDNQPK